MTAKRGPYYHILKAQNPFDSYETNLCSKAGIHQIYFLPVWQSLVLSSNVYSGSEKQTLTWKNEVFPCLHTREMSHYCFSRQGKT